MGFIKWLKTAVQNSYTEGQGGTMPIPDFPHSETIRKHYLFSGRVQNIGFRYEACLLAERLGLVGWVRNTIEGDVEAEIEGEAARLSHFVQAMQSIRRIHITNIQEREIPVRGDEKTFHIVY